MAESSVTRSVVLNNKYGLHARPAAQFVELCNRFESEVLVRKDDQEVNGKNILDIMTLGAEPGSRLDLAFNGPDAQAAAQALVELVESKFGEA